MQGSLGGTQNSPDREMAMIAMGHGARGGQGLRDCHCGGMWECGKECNGLRVWRFP